MERMWTVSKGTDGLLSVVTEVGTDIGASHSGSHIVNGKLVICIDGIRSYFLRRCPSGDILWEISPLYRSGMDLRFNRVTVSYDQLIALLDEHHPLDLQFLMFNVELFSGRYNEQT